MSDAIIVAVIGMVGLIVGHLFTRKTNKEQIILDMLHGEVKRLWERVQEQETKIRELSDAHQSERAKSWIAIEYIRTLLSHIHVLSDIMPGHVSRPSPPPIPPELEDDL